MSEVRARRRSPVTMPGYRRGQKPANAGRKFPAEVLSNDEVRALLAACSRRGRAGVRDRAMIAVGWRAGLRIGELLALEPRDVDLDLGTVTVRHGKGNKRRVLGLDAGAVELVATWLRKREALGVRPRSGPLFCTISYDERGPGRPVQDSVWRETLKRLGRRAGVEKRVHPHGLRHTFAVNMLREGHDLVQIQKALGHNDLATTARYVDHLYPGALIELMRGREWFADEPDAPAPLDAIVAAVVAQLTGHGVASGASSGRTSNAAAPAPLGLAAAALSLSP